MDFSLLLLVTPMTPPIPPAPGVPTGDIPGREAAGAVAVTVGVPAPRPTPPGRGAAPAAGFAPGAPGAPPAPGPACPAASTWKSSLVIGSLNFLRRNRFSTRVSMFGGNAPVN